MRSNNWGDWLLTTVTYTICAFILLPLAIMVATSFSTTSYITFPPQGFTLKWYPAAILDNRIVEGFLISLQIAIYSSLIGALLGVLAGLSLEQMTGSLGRVLSAFFLAPLTVPMIVFAIGALFFLESIGLGRSLQGLVLAHTVVTFPYAVRMVTASRNRAGRQLESAGAILGASPLQVFWRITLPGLRAGVVASMMFGFLIAFNFLLISLFVSGFRTPTLPLVIFQLTFENVSPMVAALGTLMALASFAIMLILERKFGIYEVLSERRGL